MRSPFPSPILLPFAFFLFSCQSQCGPLSDEDVAAIRALGPAVDEMVLAGDWGSFPSMFTEDGVLMPPNEALLPRSDFLAWIEPLGLTASEHTIEFVDISGSGDVAYARGTYSETYTLEGVEDPIEDSGKILTVLHKQPDGVWLFAIWAWSSDLPGVAEDEHSEGGEHG